MDPEALDFDSLDPNDNERNVNLAFDIAETKLGIPKLLDPEDMLAGSPDERAVILYSSMFFHAYVSDEQKRALVTEKKSIKQQIGELQASLDRERAEKERLLRTQQEVSVNTQRDISDKDALIASLRAKIKELLEEIAYLQKRSLSDAELRALLEAKIKQLHDLVQDVDQAEAEVAASRSLESGSVAERAFHNGSQKLSKEQVLAWVKEQTSGYDNVEITDLHSSFANGMALSALVHRLEPTAIDFGSLNPEEADKNLRQALAAAESALGIPTTVSCEDLLHKTATENEVAAYIEQFFQKYIAESPLFGNPSIGKDGAVPNRLAGQFPAKQGLTGFKFTPEDLLKWTRQTTQGYPGVNIRSYETSFNDGLAFAALVHAMDPSAIDFDLLEPANVADNVARALNAAEKKLGIPRIFNAADLASGSVPESKLVEYNSLFFQKFLENSGFFDGSQSRGVHANISPETDLLQWAQKVTAGYDGVNIVNFTDSFKDGLALSAIVNSIKPESLDFAALNPANVKENVENALKVAEEVLGVPRILDADALISGKADERDVIAYNARLFGSYLENVVLDNKSKYAPADLLKWVHKMTEGYDNVDVKDFKSSFADGLALSALVHAMDPSILDFNSLNPKEKKQNLVAALTIAENKLGIPQFGNVDALLDGTAEEAEVIAYTSMFLDKYIDEAGKYGVSGSKVRSVDPYGPENDLLQWAKKITDQYDNVEITSFQRSFNDGLAFAAIVDSLSPGALDFASLKPADSENNLKIAFAAAHEKLGIPQLLNVTELAEGTCDKREVAQYTAKLFQKYIDDVSTQKSAFSEADLLQWAKRTTADYDNVQVENFGGSFKDGLALAALVHAMDPTSIDFESLSSQDGKKNVEAALSAAEKKFGISSKLLNADAVVSGSAEKEVKAYVGKLLRKFVDEAGRFGKFGNSSENSLDRDIKGQLTGGEDRQAILDDLEDRKKRLLDEIARLQKNIQDEIAMRKKMAEEIDFLREQASADAQDRSILEAKATLLQSMLDGTVHTLEKLTEEQKQMAADLDAQRKRGEELGSGLGDLESERSQLLTDSEEKARRLNELEERRRKLLEELAELQKRVKEEMGRRMEQAAEIAALKLMVESMSSKQIVQSKARVGLDALKRNLEEHLEDLYRWRDLNGVDGGAVEDFDLTKVIADLSGKPFEEQIAHLDSRLQEENGNLARIIKQKDAEHYLNDTVIKSGWLVMKGHKEWKKRWFTLAGDCLTFHEDENTPDVAGSIQLDQGCDVVRHKAIKDEDGSNKKVWPLKVSVGDRKLFIRAATKKERHSWFAAISSRIAHLNYLKHCDTTGERPDSRLIGALCATSVPHIDLSFKPITPAAIDALTKGLPGRDELEGIALEDTNLSPAQFVSLCEVLEKLGSVKQFNFAHNKLDGSEGAKFAAALNPEYVTDINLSKNRLGDDFVVAIAPTLGKCTQLNTLDLEECGLTAASATALVEQLTAGTIVLQDLTLSGNELKDAGVLALLPLFSKFSFKRVRLAGNGIGDEGVVALAEALAKTSVEELDLSNNRIGPKGALALKALMESKDTFHTLILSGNNNLVTGADAQALLLPIGLKISSLTYSRN